MQAGDVIPYVMCKVNSYTESHFDVFHIARHFHDVLTEPLQGTTTSAPTPSVWGGEVSSANGSYYPLYCMKETSSEGLAVPSSAEVVSSSQMVIGSLLC